MENKMSDDLIKLLTQAINNMIAEELKQQLAHLKSDMENEDTALTTAQGEEVDSMIRNVINSELEIEVRSI